MSNFEVPNFIVVIDTENYAGNFERELTAYCTGMVGECECDVGYKESERFFQDLNLECMSEGPFYSCIQYLPDEDGCARPCKIWPTEGWFNCAGGSFREGEEEKAEKAHNKYYDNELANYDEGGCCFHYSEQSKLNAQKNLQEMKNSPINKFPCYNSVAIFFESELPSNLIETLVSRAEEYCKDNNITMTGHRVLKVEFNFIEL